MNMGNFSSLSNQLDQPDIIIAPGIYDALGAVLVEQAGFSTAYLSGASIAYTRFGRSDIGLVTMTEVAETLTVIKERSELAVVVDADTGFGNALNVMRTVRRFETAGAAAIQLEDQTLPKRCGHLSGKSLIPTNEMVGKIKAALDARHSPSTLIIARTDAIAVEGFEQALDRAQRYHEAGADILFVEAPQSEVQMQQITTRFGSHTPLLANMVEGGKTPQKNAAELQEIGYSIVIFPGGLVRAQAVAAQEYLSSLSQHGSTSPFGDRMLNFNQLNHVLGTDELLALGESYDANNFEKDT
ncbi:MAG: isocitrate lyase/phosphoenolpyruvate mutase family protein [Gammaproteobacteria bacterium]|nr:isocitrate lyase/phosphoenolpyruvate mutase family protein [Gammaproteobacteria bacterium]